MTHVVVAGWMLTETPCGASRRTLEILRAAAKRLEANERITLLFSAGTRPPDLPSAIRCLPVAIPRGPALQRALAERSVLPKLLHDLSASVYQQDHLPLVSGLRCETVLTIHDLRDVSEHRRYPSWLARYVLRRAAARAGWIVVPSLFTYGGLQTLLGTSATKVTVVPNGVALEPFAKQTIAEDPCFLHVGRLEKRKNLLMLISAYAQLVEDSKDPSALPPLVLVGEDGGERRALAERAAFLEVTGKVQMPGEVDDRKLMGLYRAARCVLVPSLYEGFGLPALEALAAGKLALVSDRGALPEVVADAGIVLAADDARAWATAMGNLEKLQSDPFLTANRQRRVRELSWDRAAESMLELWHELGE